MLRKPVTVAYLAGTKPLTACGPPPALAHIIPPPPAGASPFSQSGNEGWSGRRNQLVSGGGQGPGRGDDSEA